MNAPFTARQLPELAPITLAVRQLSAPEFERHVITFSDRQEPRNMWLFLNKDDFHVRFDNWSNETGETVWTYVLDGRGLAKLEAAGFSL